MEGRSRGGFTLKKTFATTEVTEHTEEEGWTSGDRVTRQVIRSAFRAHSYSVCSAFSVVVNAFFRVNPPSHEALFTAPSLSFRVFRYFRGCYRHFLRLNQESEGSRAGALRPRTRRHLSQERTPPFSL